MLQSDDVRISYSDLAGPSLPVPSDGWRVKLSISYHLHDSELATIALFADAFL